MSRRLSLKTKLLLLTIAVQTLAVAGLLWLRASPPGAQPPTEPQHADIEVQYTAQGFVPSRLEIPLGSRVAFRNATGSPFRPASDPFPSHSDYPDLDSGREYAPGEAYVFQFDRAGTFGYHNDSRASHAGTIRVLDLAPPPDLDKTAEDQIPIRDHLLTLFDPGDPQSVYRVIDEIEADPALARSCHSVGHDLGHRAYELYGFSAALNVTDPTESHGSVQEVCAGGYVHGVIEEASEHLPGFDAHPESLCATVSDQNRTSCFHGLGHAFMFVHERDREASLAACRSLPGSEDRYPCFEGVWMEFYLGKTKTGSAPAEWDPEQPLTPCLTASADAKPACFLYSSLGYLRDHYQDYAGVTKLCTAPTLDSVNQSYCLKGIGLTMTNRFQGQHLERSEAVVAGLSEAQKDSFYHGVLGYARFSGISQTELEASCSLFQADKALCLAITQTLD